MIGLTMPRLCASVVLAAACWLIGCGETVQPAARGPVGDGAYVRAVASVDPITTWLRLRTVDQDTGRPVPARLALWHEGQALDFARAGDPPECWGTGASLFEMAPAGGALGTRNGIVLWRGDATIPAAQVWIHRATFCNTRPWRVELPYGAYRVQAGRGPEYEIGEARFVLAPGMGVVEVTIPLLRSVDTHGYLAADLHLHTGPASGDSSVSAAHRVMTEAAAGIEILVSSDHDHHTDLSAVLSTLWPVSWGPAPVAAVVGSEVSTHAGHFNLMPLVHDPDSPSGGALSVDALPVQPRNFFSVFRALPGRPLVQMNHPRLGYAAYLDSWACGEHGWTDTGQPPPCPMDVDSIEVMSGPLACASRIRRQIDDWYALLRLGHVTTAVAGSDAHHESGILAGFPRAWLRVGSDLPSRFTPGDLVTAVRARAAIVSTGPFVTLRVDDQPEGNFLSASAGHVSVDVQAAWPGWMQVDELRLLVDGAVVKRWSLQGQHAAFEARGQILSLLNDGFITLELQGQQPLPAWMVGDHIATERLSDGRLACPNPAGVPGVVPFALTNPVFVDVDGDGLWRGVQM